MFETLFGAETPLAIRFLLAFLIVIGLIGAAAWAMRRFGTERLGGASSRGRQPRLGVDESVSVDKRRRLILVRRNNVEHLLMIGGPTDVVVEPNIVRAGAAAHDVSVARSPGAAEPLPRAFPLPDKRSSPPQPVVTPRPAPRIEPLPEEPAPWPVQSPETSTRPQRNPLAALADELSTGPAAPRESPTNVTRPNPTEPRGEVRFEPRNAMPQPVAAQRPTAETASTADKNLADLAHRLKAALRKPNAGADALPSATLTRGALSPDQALAAKAVPSPLRAPRPSEPKPARADAKPNQSETLYDNLEQELARLLGQPTKN